MLCSDWKTDEDRRRCRCAGVGREVEQDDGDLAVGAGLAAQGHEPLDAGGQHVGALGVQRPCRGRWRPSERLERPPKTIGPVAPSSSGIATMMVASTGERPRSDASHCSSVWNSSGVGGDIGHVESREHVLGRRAASL